jgi:hypothetical protein
MPERPATITTDQLARFLLLSPRRVQQLIEEGVLHRARDVDGTELRGRFHLVESAQSYIRFLRSRLESGDVSETKYLDARGRRMPSIKRFVFMPSTFLIVKL